MLVDASAAVRDVQAVLAETNSTLRAILLTHSHFDHSANAERLRVAFPNAPLYASPHTMRMLADGSWTAGVPGYAAPNWQVDVEVEEKVYTLGAFEVQVLYTPGHTVDSVCYLIDRQYLATGDTVMNDIVCGATCFATGDPAALYHSGQKLWTNVPDAASILGGHVSRISGLDYEPYTSRSTVARARHRNMINRL